MMTRTVRRKINELFEYRHLPELLGYANISQHGEFVRKLKTLQYAIYALDHQLESNWKVKQSEINRSWKEIHTSLTTFGIKIKDAPGWCKHIVRYQSHELKMRSGKWPTDYDFKYLYYYKSCDVRLLRRLIYHERPELNRIIKETDWRYYDYITEINDDIEDVFEDFTTINGNRFLIQLITEGHKETARSFRNEISELQHSYRESMRKRKLNPESKQVVKWTNQRFVETRALMKTQLQDKRLDQIDSSTIFPYLNP